MAQHENDSRMHSTDAPEPGETDDPFEAHFRREPMPKAGVCVIVLDAGHPEESAIVVESLRTLVSRRGREVECHIVTLDPSQGVGRAIEHGYQASNQPLVLVTSALEAWTEAHVAPLFEAIDHCDHVIGRRPKGPVQRLSVRLRGLLWRGLFAVPVRDVHSPCRLHRRAALDAIPLQSLTDFSDVELLAKATFLGHLIDEVEVPALEAGGLPTRHWRRDLGAVFGARRSFGPQSQRKIRSATTNVTTAQAARINSETVTSARPAPSRITARRALSNWVKGKASIRG